MNGGVCILCPMRVLYDGIAFENGHQRGVQRAFRELIERLPEAVEPSMTLLGRARADLPSGVPVIRVGMPVPRALPRKLRKIVHPMLARPGQRRAQSGCDVFHSTYDTLPICPMPTVHTVHDLVLERFSEFCSGRARTELFEHRRRVMDAATRVIAISESTAAELARFYPGCEDKTRVVHWGWEHLRRAEAPKGESPQEPYAMVVGDRTQYKNFRVVLDAMDEKAWPDGVGLVVVGPAWRATEGFRVELLSKRHKVRHAGRVSDEELARLYSGASCVISASLMEGFGFPVLEAQAAGTPLVCSDITVNHEVAGDGAVRFDPGRPDQLAARVGEVQGRGVRAGLIEAGRANLARFSWDRCIAETVAVYEEAVTHG